MVEAPAMKKCPYCAEDIQPAAIVCKHCGRDLKGGASQVQLVQKKKTSVGAAGCAILLGLVVVGTLVSKMTARPAPTAAGATAVPRAPATTSPSGGPRPAPSATPSRGRWQVEESRSAVDDSASVVLALPADSSIQGWPAQTETPLLIVRCKERKTEAYIKTGMRPVVESGNLEGAHVLLRFDKESAKTYNTNQSTDGEALFLPGAVSTIRTMAKHERMLFRFTPFNSSPQETTFDLRGLSEVLPPLKKACGW